MSLEMANTWAEGWHLSGCDEACDECSKDCDARRRHGRAVDAKAPIRANGPVVVAHTTEEGRLESVPLLVVGCRAELDVLPLVVRGPDKGRGKGHGCGVELSPVEDQVPGLGLPKAFAGQILK